MERKVLEPSGNNFLFFILNLITLGLYGLKYKIGHAHNFEHIDGNNFKSYIKLSQRPYFVALFIIVSLFVFSQIGIKAPKYINEYFFETFELIYGWIFMVILSFFPLFILRFIEADKLTDLLRSFVQFSEEHYRVELNNPSYILSLLFGTSYLNYYINDFNLKVVDGNKTKLSDVSDRANDIDKSMSANNPYIYAFLNIVTCGIYGLTYVASLSSFYKHRGKLETYIHKRYYILSHLIFIPTSIINLLVLTKATLTYLEEETINSFVIKQVSLLETLLLDDNVFITVLRKFIIKFENEMLLQEGAYSYLNSIFAEKHLAYIILVVSIWLVLNFARSIFLKMALISLYDYANKTSKITHLKTPNIIYCFLFSSFYLNNIVEYVLLIKGHRVDAEDEHKKSVSTLEY